jgi:hypothetical protein
MILCIYVPGVYILSHLRPLPNWTLLHAKVKHPKKHCMIQQHTVRTQRIPQQIPLRPETSQLDNISPLDSQIQTHGMSVSKSHSQYLAALKSLAIRS